MPSTASASAALTAAAQSAHTSAVNTTDAEPLADKFDVADETLRIEVDPDLELSSTFDVPAFLRRHDG